MKIGYASDPPVFCSISPFSGGFILRVCHMCHPKTGKAWQSNSQKVGMRQQFQPKTSRNHAGWGPQDSVQVLPYKWLNYGLW